MSDERRSQLGLDDDNSLWERLFQFIVTVILGLLIGLILATAMGAVQPPWSKVIRHACETLFVFWVLLLVYIWWKPRWLRRIYLWFEAKILLAIQIGTICVFGIVAYWAIVSVLESLGCT